MQHNKDTEFVMYVDNFLDQKTLEDLQDTFTKIEYQEVKMSGGEVYGKRHTFRGEHHKNDPLIKLIKQFFYPHRNLVPNGIHAHIRDNSKEPLFHIDPDGGTVANFLLFLKGEPLLNNGTGFMKNNSLSAHIGFVENRALFFNGSKIYHSDLQYFGDSSPRYTLNIFFSEEDE
tara:strand:- start:1500 stop:2018 length:519 start_codon:yes stop_codon:yes gene_type:complete